MLPVSLVSFGSYKHDLKTAWRKGLLSQVKKGVYGNILTQDNLSLEHIVPHSLGGKTATDNLFIADKDANSRRGTKPIMEVLTYEQLFNYLFQFVDVKNKYVNGKDYIYKIIKRIGSLKQ
jgi:hypothetical protein